MNCAFPGIRHPSKVNETLWYLQLIMWLESFEAIYLVIVAILAGSTSTVILAYWNKSASDFQFKLSQGVIC